MLTLKQWAADAAAAAGLQVNEIFETKDPSKVGVEIPKHTMTARQEQIIRGYGLRICGMLPHTWNVFVFYLTDRMATNQDIYSTPW